MSFPPRMAEATFRIGSFPILEFLPCSKISMRASLMGESLNSSLAGPLVPTLEKIALRIGRGVGDELNAASSFALDGYIYGASV